MSGIINPKDVINGVYRAVGEFKKRGFETGCIGKTALGCAIPYIKKGDEAYGKALIFGAIHAREYITAPLAVKMAEEYDGKSAIYFVPLVNVDGVALCVFGLDALDFLIDGGFIQSLIAGEKDAIKQRLLRINGGPDFSLWKANINAVDLNVNFDADWGTGTQNVTVPSPSNYIGEYPESQTETRALTDFTAKLGFDIALCYHCKGEVIYYGYKNNTPCPAGAELYSKVTGYRLSWSAGSAGGYKDWFTMTYDRLSLTFEVGAENKTYAELNGDFDAIWQRNSGVTEVTDYILRGGRRGRFG
ncbi:MAG: hypothetical protein LBQ40_03000 [Clostridiales bacterium]|jgi:g-D-glutamyl-meso-diaminopimelate peptidase|nr:hypothetical protein [Clostridiales bacterium]